MKILADGSKSVELLLRDLENLMVNAEQSGNDKVILAASERRKRKAEESGHAEIEL